LNLQLELLQSLLVLLDLLHLLNDLATASHSLVRTLMKLSTQFLHQPKVCSLIITETSLHKQLWNQEDLPVLDLLILTDQQWLLLVLNIKLVVLHVVVEERNTCAILLLEGV